MKKSKKRIILYILIVLFTLAMAGEGALVFLSRNTGSTGSFDMSSFQLPDGTSFQPDGTMPQGEGEMSQTGETMGDMPQGGNMPDMSSSGETMPQGDGSMMPQGGMSQSESDTQTGETSGQDSQMGEMPDMSSFDFDTSTLPGSTDSSGILATLRRYWIPIFAVCLLGDLICLILLRRDKKAARKAEEEAAAVAAAAADDDAPIRRKKKKWWLVPVCLVLVITVVLSSLPSGEIAVTQGDTVTVTEEVISGTAEAGTITTVLTGAGTISPETTVTVTIPSVVEVKTYHVQNGDQVYKGDVLATLDTTGLATAIAELQDVLDDLDDDLETERQTSVSTYIQAPVSGRVKAILAQAGDDAAQVTAQEGALLLISVDGLMKVEISADNLTVGETLTVRLEDGTELTGRVNSCRNGTTVVTVSDQTAPYGGKARVLSSDGTLLGEGTLEINSELRVTGTYGTISSVAVSVNQQVSQSTVLFYLKDVGYSQDYQTLLARREELEEQMEALYALYPDGQVIAETDGIVSGIPDDAEYVALNAGEETITADSLTSQGSWQIVLLSDTETVTETVTESGTEGSTESSAEGSTETTAETVTGVSTAASSEPAAEASSETVHEHVYDQQVVSDAYLASYATCQSPALYYYSCSCGASGTGTFASGETADHTWDAGVVTVEATTTSTGVRTYTCTVCGATWTEEIAAVHAHTYADTWTYDNDAHWRAPTCGDTTEAADYAAHTWDAGVVTVEATTTSTGIRTYTCTVCGATRTEEIAASTETPAAFSAKVTSFVLNDTGTAYVAVVLTRLDTGEQVIFSGTLTEQDGTALTLDSLKVDDVLYVSGDQTSAVRIPQEEPEPTTEPAAEPATEPTAAPTEEATAPAEGEGTSGEDSGDFGDFSSSGSFSIVSGGGGASGGTSTGTTTSQNSYDTYSTATTTVLTLASQETMVIEIPVDELDVLSLTEGSEAQVTLDALKGQSFTGTVSHISRSGTNSGGNTKYTVEVTLPGSDEMISGMNASVSVTTDTTEAAITVPAAALYEEGGKTYVYTGYSEKDDTLLNPVEVETGVADADTVEILSGLSEGDTYYYRYASGITYTFTI